jgi:hypothetical protein
MAKPIQFRPKLRKPSSRGNTSFDFGANAPSFKAKAKRALSSGRKSGRRTQTGASGGS